MTSIANDGFSSFLFIAIAVLLIALAAANLKEASGISGLLHLQQTDNQKDERIVSVLKCLSREADSGSKMCDVNFDGNPDIVPSSNVLSVINKILNEEF